MMWHLLLLVAVMNFRSCDTHRILVPIERAAPRFRGLEPEIRRHTMQTACRTTRQLAWILGYTAARTYTKSPKVNPQ
ncbi:hypothetical protein C8Q78DRAFT_1030862 [Trametes maxima]|nr:hypothetical protein C8Q78DRAFT_1030862 [Trametes maxima]